MDTQELKCKLRPQNENTRNLTPFKS